MKTRLLKSVALVLVLVMSLSMAVYQSPKQAMAAGITVTFKNGSTTVSSVSVDAGNTVNGAALAADGKLFAGWFTKNLGDINDVPSARSYAYDFSKAVTENTTLYAGWIDIGTGENSKFYFEGVQCRKASAEYSAGIRFITRIDLDLEAAIRSLNLANADIRPKSKTQKGIGYGTVCTFSNNITGGDMLLKDGNVIIPAYYTYRNTETSRIYTAMVVNIPESAYAQNITGRPYITYADANGSEQTYYYTENGSTSHKLGGGYSINYNDALAALQPQQPETQAPETQPETQAPETQPQTQAPETQPETQAPETQPETQPVKETEPAVVEHPETYVPTNIKLTSYFAGLDEASCSTIGQGNETADKMFDSNPSTKFYTGEGFPVRVAWKMSRAVVVKSYSITTGADSAIYSYRNPYKWQLYGSNDGTSWIQLDYVDGGGIAAVNNGVYSYNTDVQDAYQYFLLQVESNGTYYYGLQIADIDLAGDVVLASNDTGSGLGDYYGGINTSGNTVSGFGSEVAANLFDGNTATKLFNIGTGAISWEMDRPVTAYSYTLTTANDNSIYSGRLPKSWILYASNDGNNWEEIDAVADGRMADVNYTPYTYTVDKVGTYKYYKLEIKSLVGNTFQLSEIELNGAAISSSKYDILLKGDWDLINDEGYVGELIKLFYNSYPRLYARWGNGTEPRTITFMADRNYDGVAYCQGTTVCVSTNYANANPTDIGFFSHEITHSVQQYGNKLVYGDNDGWFTENMANYGGFRYFHWSNPKYVQIYEASDTSLQDWGYQKYGNNKWFFAYMDSRYPTTKDANGNITYGLLDSLNLLIKANNSGTPYSEDPYDTSNELNQCVYRITGYNCFEALRQRFVQELKAGTWNFTGFANYADNWVTENIEGIPNPEYPMLGEKVHGNTTNAKLSSAVTSGTNLLLGSSVYRTSGYINENESASKLFDGNLSTKWCATSSNVVDKTYALNKVQHWIAIDLGSVKTFNTYTLYNTQSYEGYANASEWEVLVSNDGENWRSVDYQSGQNDAISSYGIGSQSARYIMLKVFASDNGPGTLRLYEMQLYNR